MRNQASKGWNSLRAWICRSTGLYFQVKMMQLAVEGSACLILAFPQVASVYSRPCSGLPAACAIEIEQTTCSPWVNVCLDFVLTKPNDLSPSNCRLSSSLRLLANKRCQQEGGTGRTANSRNEIQCQQTECECECESENPDAASLGYLSQTICHFGFG